jgi:hypothetical protein
MWMNLSFDRSCRIAREVDYHPSSVLLIRLNLILQKCNPSSTMSLCMEYGLEGAGSYNIDYKHDKIEVFVSIVSTKVPFKTTGK